MANLIAVGQAHLIPQIRFHVQKFLLVFGRISKGVISVLSEFVTGKDPVEHI